MCDYAKGFRGNGVCEPLSRLAASDDGGAPALGRCHNVLSATQRRRLRRRRCNYAAGIMSGLHLWAGPPGLQLHSLPDQEQLEWPSSLQQSEDLPTVPQLLCLPGLEPTDGPPSSLLHSEPHSPAITVDTKASALLPHRCGQDLHRLCLCFCQCSDHRATRWPSSRRSSIPFSSFMPGSWMSLPQALEDNDNYISKVLHRELCQVPLPTLEALNMLDGFRLRAVSRQHLRYLTAALETEENSEDDLNSDSSKNVG
ncbi:unnamed protein product [Polarella glacialis]|uniref:Uncharacterized protein n=1 Tax=Polarella glacialis TaxID=89957 RepID=A0A813HYS1_POLGL|nr:unnamed protein product [Polarella glacialis]CAE8710315.1 unnamed protein product [Polarella glacialis]